jgi:uncharacterized protein (DUF2147 family)
MKTKLIILLASVCLTFSFVKEEHTKIYGMWWSPEKESKIKFFKATDGKVYGKIVWLKEPNEANGKPKLDDNNPIVAKRKNALLDLIILRSFVYDGDNEWSEGTVYDPENGKTYNCNISLDGDKKMNLRGYVGVSLLGRTAVFARVE